MTALLTPSEAAGRLQIPEPTLRRWRFERKGPAYVKVGRYVRYDQVDLEKWLETQRVRPGRAL